MNSFTPSQSSNKCQEDRTAIADSPSAKNQLFGNHITTIGSTTPWIFPPLGRAEVLKQKNGPYSRQTKKKDYRPLTPAIFSNKTTRKFFSKRLVLTRACRWR
jgi:hypothetical protein